MIESGFENKSVWGSSGILMLGEQHQAVLLQPSCGLDHPAVGAVATGTAMAGSAGSLIRDWLLGMAFPR